MSHTLISLFLIDEVSDNRYPGNLVNNEKEVMKFTEVQTTSALVNDTIRLNSQSINEQILDKYTFSNALALSVKLGIWEALLDDEVEFVADLANRLKQGKHIKIEHGLMQRKSGELYSLKHAVNLSHGKSRESLLANETDTSWRLRNQSSTKPLDLLDWKWGVFSC